MIRTSSDIRDAAASFQRLHREAQHRVMARWLHALTIAGRDTYEPASDQVADPQRLRRVHELEQTIISQLASSLEQRERYPDAVFAEMVLAGGSELDCLDRLTRILSEAAAA